MGAFSKIVHKIFIISIMMVLFFLLSLHRSHILIIDAEASLDAASADYYYSKVQKVSGEDENEQKEALIVEKFRTLLGLRSFKASKRPLHGHDSEYFSPAPSPAPSFEAETPAPAPATLQPIRAHSHHPSQQSNPKPHHKIQKESTDKGRVRRVLLPVLVSTGAVFVACVLGVIWVCCNRKYHKKSIRTMSVFGKKGRIKGTSKYASSQRSTSKVNLNPSLDLFYLNSLGGDLEQQTSCLKPINENVTTSSKKQEVIKSESDNASSSSTREITSVHEDAADSIKYQSDGGNSSSGDKIIPIECHSSDDESFHSFNDSNSSNIRLSNASAASVSDTQEIFSPNLAKIPQSPMPSSPNLQNEIHHTLSNDREENMKVAHSPDCQKNFEASPSPPPPPLPTPPPLPPIVSYSHSKSSSCPAKLISKASCSSTMQSLSSPRNSDSSSELHQTTQSVLLSPQETLKPSPAFPGIPPPPCPPPPFKQKKCSMKGPPPPPSLLPHDTPLGKDGAPLPKLKPLHWDKVRAAPDRSMVWDKLKSSSFE